MLIWRIWLGKFGKSKLVGLWWKLTWVRKSSYQSQMCTRNRSQSFCHNHHSLLLGSRKSTPMLHILSMEHIRDPLWLWPNMMSMFANSFELKIWLRFPFELENRWHQFHQVLRFVELELCCCRNRLLHLLVYGPNLVVPDPKSLYSQFRMDQCQGMYRCSSSLSLLMMEWSLERSFGKMMGDLLVQLKSLCSE